MIQIKSHQHVFWCIEDGNMPLGQLQEEGGAGEQREGGVEWRGGGAGVKPGTS